MPALNTVRPAQPTSRQHVLGRLIYSQSPAAGLVRRVVAVLGVALGLSYMRMPLGSLLSKHIYSRDILQGYTLARAISDRIDPYLPTRVLATRYSIHVPETVFAHPTRHPPTLGLLLLPLAFLGYPTAAMLWLGLELACLVASVYLLGQALDTRLSPWMTLGIASVLLIWYPFWEELAWGQLQIPMLMLLAGAWVALRSVRSLLGGALVGLAMLFKPLPLPLLLLFGLRKDWPAIAGAFSVVLGACCVAACAVGVGTLATYFTQVLPLVSRTYRAALGNISVWSLGWRLFDGTGGQVSNSIVAPPLVSSLAAAQLTSTALPALLLVVALLAVRKQRSLDLSFAVMMGVSILTSPISWPHSLVLAAIPAAQAIRWLVCHRLPSQETNVALIVTMLLMIDWQVLARFLASLARSARGTNTLPFALAQLPLMTAVAVAALAWLITWLGPVEKSLPVTVEE